LVFFVFVCVTHTRSQSVGSIKPYPGKTETASYVYTPPRRLALPQKIFVSFVYQVGEEYFFKKDYLTKSKGKYIFAVRLPDSAKSFVLTITNERGKVIDNNRDSGYTILCIKKSSDAPAARVEAALLLSYYAPVTLRLDRRVLQSKMIKLFEEAYKISPGLTQTHKTYRYYLLLRNQQEGESARPGMLEYAKKMEAQGSDASLATALYIYRFLHLDDKVSELENRCISKFPSGEVAREKYVNEFYDKRGKNEYSILNDMRDFSQRFTDSSYKVKYTFYVAIIEWLFAEKKYEKLSEYEQRLGDNMNLASIYNSQAKYLLEEVNTDSAGDALRNASHLIKQSLRIAESVRKSIHWEPEDQTLQKAINKFRETYALALFHQGKYDSAFYYQSLVVSQSIDPGSTPSSALQLVNYAEKDKGDQFARNLAIDQFKEGNDFPELVEKFEQLNRRLGISDTEMLGSRPISGYASNKMVAKIKSRFGSQQSKNFTLQDLNGNTVSLASFKNKIIVLDFWASWCGPCKASFPHMQEVTRKYANDSSIVFLFIDTWESKSFEKMKMEAAKYIHDNHYNFRVLLDDKNKAGNAYKVDYVPETFVIDRKGNIIFMGNDNANIVAEIENAKKITP
ncbi:MAG: redoxin domain-containing protein, partial [Pseudobacter sp.]|uniref:redoxin domain-containing protein n=1 Tax=Pseudobacter sp. TaxID=2045420 RepID=UPI003F80B233